MPELPEVEDFRILLTAHLPGTRVLDVRVLDPQILRNATPRSFSERLVGTRFEKPLRHGKWLIVPTDGPTLLIHNATTGRLYFVDAGVNVEADRYDRLLITTDAGDLHYADLRKLRGIWICDDRSGIADVIGIQGPDALTMPAVTFVSVLFGRRGGLKTTLMDQRVIAGLGNMVCDEICWRAGLHPGRPLQTLDHDELERVYRVMHLVLRDTIGDHQLLRERFRLCSTRDQGPVACPRCATILRRAKVGGRTSIA
ncbi:MAG: formamidopyrimidine-DNA glycosylase, partial [Pseudonocardiales bacterium]|nr:formamidopyrimidine-DNA glycosylase [Pseudonocardiales bacterium]